MKYFAQPDYNNRQVQVYSLPATGSAQLITTISLASAASGPNDVLLYQTASAWSMFVSYDLGDTGLLEIYNFATVLTSVTGGTASISPAATKSISVGSSLAGMAIQPGSGDLYVATFQDGAGDGGVRVYTAASSYATATEFCTGADNSVTKYCANLAFDESGNLWMTTFDDFNNSSPADQFLICYPNLGGSLSKNVFFKIVNASATFTNRVKTLPGSVQNPPASLVLLSSPEGIALDPDGNLWLANNNEDAPINGDNNGTLVRIDKSWIAAHMFNNASLNSAKSAGANGVTLNFGSDDSSVTVFYHFGSKFGGLVFDGYTLYVHDQENGGGTQAVVWKFDTTNLSPTASTFFASGIVTDYPGNGGSSIFNATPPRLMIRDTTSDDGTEPDSTTVPWESPDIAVNESSTIASLPAANSTINNSIALGSGAITSTTQAAFIVVRVANIGAAGSPSSTGTEVLKLYWAKASAGLSWPAPWNGLSFDTTASTPPLGGFIGAKAIPITDPGKESFVEFTWPNPPDSAKYTVNDQHFCLLARIETIGVYPYGLDKPEETNLTPSATSPLVDNVVNNRALGWRNVSITASVAPGSMAVAPGVKFGVIGANFGPTGTFHLTVNPVAIKGRPAPALAKVTVQALNPTALKLLTNAAATHAAAAVSHPAAASHTIATPLPIATTIHPSPILAVNTPVLPSPVATVPIKPVLAFEHLGDGLFQLNDPVAGIQNIPLATNQTIPLSITYTPPAGVTDYAVRAVQTITVGNVTKTVGGQTIVVGNVPGFPVTPPPAVHPNPVLHNPPSTPVIHPTPVTGPPKLI